MDKISVVIPTLNAGSELDSLLTALEKQTVSPSEILVIDSASEDDTVSVAGKHTLVRVHRIDRKDFNHGGTRDEAFSLVSGEIVVFITQDAMPASELLLEKLTAPLKEAGTVAAYARQLPKPEASAREKLVRSFNYPEQSERHTEADLPERGIKTFFLSDVCSAYRRKEYLELGGFERDVTTNEDMFFAARAIRAGYTIAYAAEAEVYHSHDFSLGEQYRRNRLQGYEIERHKELLENASSSKEGIAMLKQVSGQLLKQGRIFSVFGLAADCGVRYLGSRAGRKDYLKKQQAGAKKE